MESARSTEPWQIIDTAPQGGINLMDWCPKPALALASLLASTVLAEASKTWKRLCTWNPKRGANVSALRWRPDSKALAVGCTDGYVRILDVESEAQLFEEPLLPSEVSSISWTQADTPTTARKYVERAQKLLHPLKPLQKHSNLEKQQSGRSMDNAAVNIDPTKPIHMLVCGDITGNVVMCVHGQFPLGKLDLRTITSAPAAAPLRIMQAHLSKDLSTLSVFHKSAGSSNAPAVLGLAVIDTQMMRTAQSELAHVVGQLMHCQHVLLYIDTVSKQIETQWKAAMCDISEKMQLLSALLRDNGAATSAREELLSMLSCGVVSAPLNQFICQKLQLAGIAALEKKFDASCSSVLTLLTNHLNVAIDHIVFRMGELTGLARWRERFGSIGLNQEALEKACEGATKLRLRTEQALHTLCKVRSNLKAFFQWLLASCYNLSDGMENTEVQQNATDLALVADFLHHDLNEDRVLSELSNPNDGMQALFCTLVKDVSSLVALPGNCIYASFCLRTCLPLLLGPECELFCRVRATTVDGAGSSHVYAVASQMIAGQAGRSWLVRLPLDNHQGAIEAVELELDDRTFVDADFYDQEQLGVLSSTGDSSMAVSMASYDELDFEPVGVGAAGKGMLQAGVAGAQVELRCTHVLATGAKPFTEIHMLGAKGFGCVFRRVGRIVVYDVEYEDDEEESDEE